MAPNICRSSVRNRLHFALLTPRNFRCFLRFWKICGALILTIQSVRKRFYPFFIFIFFLGAQYVESGVSCTDCY
jgi:hypothetical protein